MVNKTNQPLHPGSPRFSEHSTLPAYRWLGEQEYTAFLIKMQQHCRGLSRQESGEAVWFCEHQPVYTTGKRGILNSETHLNAPVITTDRGGETTFHGSGQLMMYPLLNLKHYQLSVRDYVFLLEESCIRLLHDYHIQAKRECGLPGVWVGQRKIAALGIRISQGVTSHGMALNINTDLSWFDRINPCGTSRKMTTMSALGINHPAAELISQQWYQIFRQLLTASSA